MDIKGKICLIPKNIITIAYKDRPEDSCYRTKGFCIKPNQYVMVVNDNKAKNNPNNLFYQVIAKEGIVWIHNFDLIRVNQKNGKPEMINTEDDIYDDMTFYRK